jgi:tyrosine-protein phosphatase YwqE
MSFISAPPKLEHYLFRLQTKGYRPLLAHPERYLFFREDFKRYGELKDRGCEFQLNLLSLTGYYGKPTRENAVALLKSDMIDYLGTDLHHDRHADNLSAALEDRNIAKLLEGKTFKNIQLQ